MASSLFAPSNSSFAAESAGKSPDFIDMRETPLIDILPVSGSQWNSGAVAPL
jgi:hypothetical protein